MPRSKDPRNYDPRYEEALERVVDHRKFVWFPCGPDQRQARKIQANYTSGFLYSLTIIQRRVQEAEQKWRVSGKKGEFPRTAEDSHWLDVLARARQVTTTVDWRDDQWWIVFKPKEFGPYGMILRNAVEEDAPAEELTPADMERQAKLVDLLNRIGKPVEMPEPPRKGPRPSYLPDRKEHDDGE